MTTKKLDVEQLISTGLDCWRVADLFEEWFGKLNLGFQKAVIPLAHNWPHDAAFLHAWLGHLSFNH
jgi:hypothetical protein